MGKRADLILGVIVLIVGILYLWQVTALPKGDNILNSSQSFPLIIGAGLVLLSVLLIVKETLFKKNLKQDDAEPTKINLISGLFYTVVTGVYIFVLIPVIGFTFSTLLYVLVMIMHFREVKWYTAVITSSATMLFVYFVFNQLLKISLP